MQPPTKLQARIWNLDPDLVSSGTFFLLHTFQNLTHQSCRNKVSLIRNWATWTIWSIWIDWGMIRIALDGGRLGWEFQTVLYLAD